LASKDRGTSKRRRTAVKSDVVTKNQKTPVHLFHRNIGKSSTAFKALKFLGSFLVLALVANLFLGSSPLLKSLAAQSSAALLGLSGRPASVDYSFPDPQVRFGSVTADIGDYCSAGLEIAVLFGIIFSSDDRTLKRRAYGFAAGVLLILLFNVLRIFTVLYFFSYSSPMLSFIFHDVLFRASLVVFLATYYAVWYYWDEKAGASA
jgi:exosortase/archaeosortase family protein